MCRHKDLHVGMCIELSLQGSSGEAEECKDLELEY